MLLIIYKCRTCTAFWYKQRPILRPMQGRNQSTEVVWLPPRKDPNQQAMLGHMHDPVS